MRSNREISMILLTALTVMPFMGCESMQEHGTATGTVIGAGIGALAGAAIDRHHPGTGAALGALAGGLAGNVIGHEIEKQWERTQAARRNQETMNQEQVNQQYIQANPTATLPPQPQFQPVPQESFLRPSVQVGPGQSVDFLITYQIIGQSAYSGTICRKDALTYYDPEKRTYEPVKDFDAECTLPTAGKNSNSTMFTVPPSAPAGTYRLRTQIVDQSSNAPLYEMSYDFAVVASAK